MKLLVIHGPNLNMLGIREPEIYGKMTHAELEALLQEMASERHISLTVFQSNHEGAIIDQIQEAYQKIDGIIINAGAYTHTSIAILDALKSVNIPTVEVHLSDIYQRESFRHHSYLSAACIHSYYGEGVVGYRKAMETLIAHNNATQSAK